jgi:hypothetical protein
LPKDEGKVCERSDDGAGYDKGKGRRGDEEDIAKVVLNL